MTKDGYMIMAILLVVFLLALVVLALLLAGRLGRKKKVPVYIDDEPRDNIMPYYDEGMPSCFSAYDLSYILLVSLYVSFYLNSHPQRKGNLLFR